MRPRRSSIRRSSSQMVQQYLINNPDGTATRLVGATAGATSPGANTVDLSIQRGWFIDFPVSRERVNIDAKLVLGTLIVPTIVPVEHRVRARRHRLAQLLRLPDRRRGQPAHRAHVW